MGVRAWVVGGGLAVVVVASGGAAEASHSAENLEEKGYAYIRP